MTEKYISNYKLKKKSKSHKRNLYLNPESSFETKVKLTRDITKYTVRIMNEISDMVMCDTIGIYSKEYKRFGYDRKTKITCR